jgi:hypothetical protein
LNSSRKILKNLRGFGKPQRLLDPLRSFSDLEGFNFLKEDTEKPSRFLETSKVV